MGMDLIARASATAARTDAATALQRSAGIDLFTDLPGKSIDASITRITTKGYSTAGTGAALYISDSLADATLAAAHPRFCKASANGRYFRLVGDYMTVEQGGAVGLAGTNDQPAIQAAVKYAGVVGIREVRFTKLAYESWQPTFPGGTPDPAGGLHILVLGDVALIGAPGGTTFNLKGQGGVARTKTDGTSTWYAGWMACGGSTTRSVLRDITVNGSITFTNNLSNGEANVYDKGVLLSDAWSPGLIDVDHRNVELSGFAGEIWYMGGTLASCSVYVENLTLYNSPQAAWNPGSLAKVFAVNLQAYDTYQSAEIIGGYGHTYVGGRFGRCSTSTILGLSQFTGGYPYWWPALDTTKPLPWITFEGTCFENCNTQFSSWIRGNIVTVDCNMSFGQFAARDVDIDIEAWCDVSNNAAAVSIKGPNTTTDAVSGAPGGTVYPLCANHRIRLRVNRTKSANDGGRQMDGIQLGGLFDRFSCFLEVSGNVRYAFPQGPGDASTPVSGYGHPLAQVGLLYGPNGSGGRSSAPTVGTTTTLVPNTPGYAINPSAAGTATIVLNTAYNYVHGQRIKFIHTGSAGRNVLFPVGGAGLGLTKARTLYSSGDSLVLEYSAYTGKWYEVSYSSATGTAEAVAPVVLTDAATVTPDFGQALDFEWTMAGNRTLANPSNAVAGQTGTIRVTQDATGTRVITYGANWRFPGGSATGGVLSTAANSVDLIRWTVGNDGKIYARLDKAMAA